MSGPDQRPHHRLREGQLKVTCVLHRCQISSAGPALPPELWLHTYMLYDSSDTHSSSDSLSSSRSVEQQTLSRLVDECFDKVSHRVGGHLAVPIFCPLHVLRKAVPSKPEAFARV